MKITLISPYPDITAFGMRTMSSYLKKHGHRTQLLFLPDHYVDEPLQNMQRYEDQIIDEAIALCKESDLIGITLMTSFFSAAVEITTKLKKAVKTPIIWGGIHPTIRPDECLEYADMVCVGDGEDALLELVNKMEKGEDYSQTKNIWIKENVYIKKNPLRQLERNLDTYPIPDYSGDDHYIMFDGHMSELTSELTRLSFETGNPASKILKKTCYLTMSGKGCPHKCTYCLNDFIMDLYKGQIYLRWRSVSHLMEELLWVKKHMPYVNYILFADDVFLARSLKNLEEFGKEYKEKIGLPFSCLASPLTITDEKMALLVDSGMIDIQMGVESASPRIQGIFNRKIMSNERVMDAMKIINKYKDRILPARYDFIVDVPYETDEDKIETLRFISKIPKPFKLQTFSLVLHPETKLYKMAKEDGFIKDEKSEIYAKAYSMKDPNYINLLMMLTSSGLVPSFLIRLLISKPVIKALNSNAIKPLFRHLYLLLKGIYQWLKKQRVVRLLVARHG